MTLAQNYEQIDISAYNRDLHPVPDTTSLNSHASRV
jgi:hypothetical protein